MNIENLKMFCLVVDLGSISQAARLNYVSQPAVTRQIHQLENFYGTLLFDRADGRLRVTEAGQMLYPFAKVIVDDFNRSIETIRQLKGGNDENLKIGASLTIGDYLLPSLLGSFKKINPDIKLTLNISNTPSILEDLSNDLIDIALVEGIVENTNFIVEEFREDELVLICSIDHPWSDRNEITVEELINDRMIWRESISGTRLIVENSLKEFGILDKLDSYLEIGSTQAIKSAVEAGLGISILPRLTVSRELKLGLLCNIKMKEVELKRNLWLVRKPKRFDKLIVSNFIDFIKNNQNEIQYSKVESERNSK
ncbi:LysR family transcriptional regulator [Peribacillus alkalitolerans]|uniref:LysR family transcriptional regulator n=1 Tax=Peribacillus alkalitolerans TaxID=1550385 RepID=UPI0013D3BB0E|nr:LysR family transcriptional regulator [Peribacillus alkalitolerans]